MFLRSYGLPAYWPKHVGMASLLIAARAPVAQRGRHFHIGRVGDPFAVVFDGSDALIAGGHQGIAPGGELGEVGH